MPQNSGRGGAEGLKESNGGQGTGYPSEEEVGEETRKTLEMGRTSGDRMGYSVR